MSIDTFPPSVRKALRAVPRTRKTIAAELRKMALGEGDYRSFFYATGTARGILHAAADLLECGDVQGAIHDLPRKKPEK